MKRVHPAGAPAHPVAPEVRVPLAETVSVLTDVRIDYSLLTAVTAALERRGYTRADVEHWIATIGAEEYWETYVAPILDLIEDSLPVRR